MAASELPGVYKVGRYRARGRAVATNKPPTAPYRGVSRPQIVLVMERLMDIAARELGVDPVDIRRRNVIRPEDFPYTGPNGITYDPGSYLESLDTCDSEITALGWRDNPAPPGTARGVGIACFSERTAYGTATMGMRKMQMTPGYDVVHVRMDPSGEVVVTTLNPDYPLVRFGTGDLSAVLPGTCRTGRTNMRIKGWLGRADQTTKVRGMFVHPGQVGELLRRHPELRAARLVVSGAVGADVMTLHCEAQRDDAALADAVATSMREVMRLKGEVRFVPAGSLPQDGKLIEDARRYD